MIDILRQKPFFPLKNFEDVEKLFEFNIDKNNGEPNLALLSIVAGLIEHSLVVVSDKDDLVANSRPVEHRKDLFQNRLHTSTSKIEQSSTSISLASTSNQTHLLSSTSSEHSNYQQPHRPSISKSHETKDFNEAAYVSSGSFDKNSSNHKSSYNQSNDSDNLSYDDEDDLSPNDNLSIPEIEYEIVETLYKRFIDQLKASIDFKDIEPNKVNLKIKKISDSVWAHLSNSYYKDKAHLQNIFSYLTTSKLDCFGLAFAVIAGCQALNLKNIYLALSEDHAWVMFDDDQNREKQKNAYLENNLPIPSCALHGTCEVTWHGKANSDKRGQPVTFKNCWLYTNGYAVKCDVRQCVLALVNSINPFINSNTDSEILALLQQRLLWMLYRKKYYFPMALGNLGELENLCPTPGAPLEPIELFHLGIEISRNEYNDSHVYPYTYLASYFYRHGRFKEALETWADGSAVMTKYNYSRDDEEIYKEFFEVANELIPSMLKVLTAGGIEPGGAQLKPFLQDAECLALILKFYDNICVWEEGSSTPVLHIGWAKNFVATVLKFSSFIRSKIKLLTEDEWSNNINDDKVCSDVENSEDVVSSRTTEHNNEHKDDKSYDNTSQQQLSSPSIDSSTTKLSDQAVPAQTNPGKRPHECHDKADNEPEGTRIDNEAKNLHIRQQQQYGSRKKAMKEAQKPGPSFDHTDKVNRLHDNIRRISQATIITPDDKTVDTSAGSSSLSSMKKLKTGNDVIDSSHLHSQTESQSNPNSSAMANYDITTKNTKSINKDNNVNDQGAGSRYSHNDEKVSMSVSQRSLYVQGDHVTIILKSSKIAGLRDLLSAERLNKTAIELQLTAQSQCAVRGRSNSNSYSSDFIPTSAISSLVSGATRSKRSHR